MNNDKTASAPNGIFTPADILIPDKSPIDKWSVIACDQFSSDTSYWERVKQSVGDNPSALNMIIPEAYLSGIDEETQAKTISAAIDKYLDGGVFREYADSFIYIERALNNGKIRKGIAGAVDLEHYDFSKNSTLIRASEGTILDRLPARINIRKAVKLEMPHIIAFINDAGNTVIEPLSSQTSGMETVYDFDLMEGGGHITGRKVTAQQAGRIVEAAHALAGSDIFMIIGDGNHSLAAAKVYWNDLKQSLSESERETHPARKALVEVCNVFDPAIEFEAIHRVLFNTDTNEFTNAFLSNIKQGNDYILKLVTKSEQRDVGIGAACIGDLLVMVQAFIEDYIARNTGIQVDYIHGADSVVKLSQDAGNIGIILPSMDKSELFNTVSIRGVFPKKSFSVGHAAEKRYYLECRRIK